MTESFSWPWVEAQVSETIEAWEACADLPLPTRPQFTLDQWSDRETAYDEALQSVERETKKKLQTKAGRLASQRRIAAMFPRFAATALGIEGDAVQLLTDSFLPAGSQFARMARSYDPALSMADIVQACRNGWTVCGLQSMFGDPFGITPSALGYSLLYPYSDNYLDDPKISTTDKIEFSARFRSRLRGDFLIARNQHEESVWKMVQLIESQYPRLRFPQVYECLLAIHFAQELSIAQVKACGDCEDGELLRISCAKGGTSVLADACLSHGWLNDDESRFAFNWGLLLQLGDDLQDVREDLGRGSATLFTHALRAGLPLDSLANQLLNYSERVASGMDRFPCGSQALKKILCLSWRSLIVMAVANSPEFFTPRFLADLEGSSAVRFDFLRARQKRLVKRRGLYQTVFEAFLATESDSLPVSCRQVDVGMPFEELALPSR